MTSGAMKGSAMLAAALAVASCGGRAPTLPDNMIDRAATCGVITAFQARAAITDVQAPLPFEAQGRILHYALLGAARDETFSQDEAAAINARMSALQEQISDTKWQKLIPACEAVFPEAGRTEVELPANALDARLGCDALGDFLGKAMAGQGQYGNELADYSALSVKLDQSTMTSELRRRAGDDRESQQRVRNEALAKIVKAGQPMAVMRACMARYG